MAERSLGLVRAGLYPRDDLALSDQRLTSVGWIDRSADGFLLEKKAHIGIYGGCLRGYFCGDVRANLFLFKGKAYT